MKKKLVCLSVSLILAHFLYAQSPYINKVYAYVPAPGQFINTLPVYSSGDTEITILSKVSEKIVGKMDKANIICLGAWGGYVTVGFDHSIINLPDSADFEVGGNAFYQNGSTIYGSFEPGIIYVSRDDNGNGYPDDTWYEIQGSETTVPYSITYLKPADLTTNVKGVDSKGDTVVVKRNNLHKQAYYPEWIKNDRYTFSGRLLASNMENGKMKHIGFGYADNAINGTKDNFIDIEWAVDENGQRVHLDRIDFIKVQTGVSADGGIYGELSTEICGARDLHPEITTSVTHTTNEKRKYIKFLRDGQLIICHDRKTYNVMGELYR